jgi:hypothetical protein
MLLTLQIQKKEELNSYAVNQLQILQDRLVLFSFFNLFVVALLGILLRAYPLVDDIPLSYKNILHGHSHFAFGGWVMPVLLALLLQTFPQISQSVAYKHWRNIAFLLLISAYGMLVSFPIQGYKTVSIFFSTMSVAAGYYLAFVVWQAMKGVKKTVAIRLLQWGLIYLSLSAIGPFATGPIIAMGHQGSPLYYNAIYYYLHFQYNGWFTFAILAILYQLLEQKGCAYHGRRVFFLLNTSCILTFFLSVLWNEPGTVFNIIGGIGAVLQLVAIVYLMKDIRIYHKVQKWNWLFRFAISAFALKIILQLVSAIPLIALLAYQYRNFVIAYLHLVLLGFVSVFAFDQLFRYYQLKWNGWLKAGITFFLFSFITTESLLIIQALGVFVSDYAKLLLWCSIGFPAGVLLVYKEIFTSIRD